MLFMFFRMTMKKRPHNKLLQSDRIILSCLLQKAQKPFQHALVAEERRYAALSELGSRAVQPPS